MLDIASYINADDKPLGRILSFAIQKLTGDSGNSLDFLPNTFKVTGPTSRTPPRRDTRNKTPMQTMNSSGVM